MLFKLRSPPLPWHQLRQTVDLEWQRSARRVAAWCDVYDSPEAARILVYHVRVSLLFRRRRGFDAD